METTGTQRTIVYHYRQGGELVGETVYNSAGAKIGERDYVWLDALPLAQSERVFSGGSLTSSQLVYVHGDQLDTPRLATNGSGTVVWRWDSDAFGLGAANQDPDGDSNIVNVRLRFPGQYLDEETALHYNYHRHYWANAGRYVEPDPIGLAGGLNQYLYVDGNPLRWTDPLGLSRFDKFYGLPKQFWRWFHKQREMKDLKGPDGQVPKETAEQYHSEWEKLGRPGPDSRKNQRGFIEEGLLDWLMPWQLTPFPLGHPCEMPGGPPCNPPPEPGVCSVNDPY